MSDYRGFGVHDPHTGEAMRVYETEGKSPPLKRHPVLVILKLTNTPSKSMKNTSTTKTMETLPKSTQQSFPTLTSLSEDSPAKHLALLESEGDLTTQEELSSLISQGFSKKSDQDCSCWK